MSRSILVIDDEPDIQFMIRLILELQGYEVQEAGTGQEGIEFLRNGKPDVVLLDIGLPDMTGWEVLDKLRDINLAQDLRIVVLTAHVSSGSSEKASGYGCSGFVSKPFRPEDLIRTLERVVA